MQRESQENPLLQAMDPSSAKRILSTLEDRSAGLESGQGLPAIEGYVVIRRIGAGGTGEVYEAVRSGSDRPLAVKLLTHRLGSGPQSQRGWRELDVLSQLRIRSIPQVLDYGVHDGRMFIVTEFVEGSPLDQYCRDHGGRQSDTVELLADVAEAVHGLHEHGVIHRDLKPANILIDAHGDPVIIDLGLASLMARDAMETLTVEGTPMGSPAFMAPEQARGDRQAVSTRTDVYSLGATAYLLLTGDTPHDMNTDLHEAIRRVAQDPPRDPRSLSRSIGGSLRKVLLKAIAQRPSDRYASAAALAADLRRWCRGEPVEAGDPSLVRRCTSFVGRHPLTLSPRASKL